MFLHATLLLALTLFAIPPFSRPTVQLLEGSLASDSGSILDVATVTLGDRSPEFLIL